MCARARMCVCVCVRERVTAATLCGAVKMAEKLNSDFVPNLSKLELSSNLKGMISVRGEKAFGFSPGATRGRIEQNITNAGFFKA